MKHVRFAAVAALCLYASGALAQTQEQVQEQLVDSVAKTEQEINRAVEKLKGNDTAGGCTDLRAAAADTAKNIDLAKQLTGIIKTDTALSEEARGRMLQDVVTMSNTFATQKQSMDAQLASRCS